ncbi:MAG TPA: STAS domain-containing protein [Actinomycetota bacterium]|nr:STAS domain-containing protein [Actinomycetota bacterium]
MALVVPNPSCCGSLSVEIVRTSSPTTLHLRGELDLGSAQVVGEVLMQTELEETTPLVVDLSEVTFMDCSGLSVLLGAFNRACRDDRELFITNARPQVRRIFALTGCKYLLADPARETLKA